MPQPKASHPSTESFFIVRHATAVPPSRMSKASRDDAEWHAYVRVGLECQLFDSADLALKYIDHCKAAYEAMPGWSPFEPIAIDLYPDEDFWITRKDGMVRMISLTELGLERQPFLPVP